MKKVLVGILVVALVAIGGYFGASQWARMQTEREVEAVFDAMRAAGLTARHGAIGVGLLGRTFVIDDVVVQSSNLAMNITAPRIELSGLSVPAAPARAADRSTPIAAARAALDAIDVGSINVPAVNVSARSAMPAAGAKPATDVDVTYAFSGIVVRDLRNRRIASASFDRIGFTMSGGVSPELGKINGEFAKWTTSEIDLDAVLAVLDPAELTKSGPYRRAYGPVTAGAFKMQFEKGGGFQIDSMTLDGFDVQPAKYNLAQIMGMLEIAQKNAAAPSPAQTRQLLDTLAGIYEGMRMGRAEARGITFVIPPGGEIKFAAMRMSGFENGRLADFTLEGLNAQIPQQGLLTLGRFSLIGLNFSNLMRLGGQLAVSGGRLGPEHSAGPLPLIEGVAVDRLRVPIKQAREPVVIDRFDFNWGQFVGPIPTKAGLKLAFSTPLVSEGNEDVIKLLAAEGVTAVKADLDIAAGWAEAAKTFAISPLALEVADWFSANAAASVGNVPRDVFIIDPNYSIKLTLLTMALEVGPLELKVRDTGMLDRVIGIYAKQHGVSPEEARKSMIDELSSGAEPILAAHPELKPVVDALSAFLATSKGSLAIKLTPNGRVLVAQLAGDAQSDPYAPLARFNIEAGNQ
jgi:hypothetical protein